MNIMSAPRLDGLLRYIDISLLNSKAYDGKVKEKINKLYEMLDKIKPIGDDNLFYYFCVNKGSVEDYGDYEEVKCDGEVSSARLYNLARYRKNVFEIGVCL